LSRQHGSSTGSTRGLASIEPHASSSVLFRTQCPLTESGVATSFGAHLHNAIAACYISKQCSSEQLISTSSQQQQIQAVAARSDARRFRRSELQRTLVSSPTAVCRAMRHLAYPLRPRRICARTRLTWYSQQHTHRNGPTLEGLHKAEQAGSLSRDCPHAKSSLFLKS